MASSARNHACLGQKEIIRSTESGKHFSGKFRSCVTLRENHLYFFPPAWKQISLMLVLPTDGILGQLKKKSVAICEALGGTAEEVPNWLFAPACERPERWCCSE